MNKKILGVTVTFIFSICLIVTANIEEVDAEHADSTDKQKTYAVAEKNNEVAAGVCSVLSGYSFTTESDEKTFITKNENYRVRSQEELEENAASDQAATTQEQPQTGEAAEVQQEQQEEIYTNRWSITLTGEETDLLAKIVWLEAAGEPVLGQEAVVEVIFNRMASDRYPDTLYEVLSQQHPTQFCSWKNRDAARPTEKEYQSIHEVLTGNTNILRNDTLYFSTEPLTSATDVTIGGHSFCY